jgi:transposase InsO family protein
MLRELNVVEQRYRAVLEVLSGIPVTEVAERYGVVRQTVHRWMARYRAEGIAGLAERSHAPKQHPWQTPAQVEAVICELRRAHRRWGPRRLVFELDRRGYPGLSRSTVYRVLVRHRLIEPVPRPRRRDQYRRWERSGPMQLWQMDVTGSLFLADGRECKIVTGIDDHSRFCVIAAVTLRATARVVCSALITAMRSYGVPGEILTDNGSVFTGRFMKPRPPVEVLFDRICRENGIAHLLTKVASPTTTGKIERLHQTLQQELLDIHGPFETVRAAQGAVDAWRAEYNADRPHQSLAMAFPTARFAAATGEVLGLRIPAELSPWAAPPQPADHPAAQPPPAEHPAAGDLPGHGLAVELDRVVPPSGNLWLASQQIWLGPALAGRTVRLWASPDRVHVLLDGHRIKTLPSRLDHRDLTRLAARGAQPAGPPPLPPPAGGVIELERTVNASGNISLGNQVISAGAPLAGQRVTLRLDGPVAHVLANGTLVRTLACPVPEAARPGLRGARAGTAQPPQLPQPLTVRRRVSVRGAIMIGRQRIQVGLTHARKTADVTIGTDTYQITVEDGITLTAARTTSRDIRRHKAASYPPRITVSASEPQSQQRSVKDN